MKIHVIGPLMIMDPEYDKNFNLGVYLGEDGKYAIANSLLSFQNTRNLPMKVGGELRDRPYFIVQGQELPNGEKEVKSVVEEANRLGNVSREGLIDMIRNKVPKVVIFDDHDTHMEVNAHSLIKMFGLPKK